MKRRYYFIFLQITCIFFLPLISSFGQTNQNSIITTLESQDESSVTLYPHIIGQISIGITYSVYVYENYAYVTTQHEVVIVDINNPAKPVNISKIDVEGTVPIVYVRDFLAYIITSDTHIFLVVNVSNPINPIVLGSFDLNVNSEYYTKCGVKMQVDGNYAYAMSHNEGFLIFDIHDPTNPTLIYQKNDKQYGSGDPL